MIEVRHGRDRGAANFGWLDSRHSFSFGNYYDPERMGFSSLRVINEDKIAPGKGFGTHGHRDMEIVTYVLDGALEHKDSLGNGSIMRPGDVQRMTAGTGILHSEFNPSPTEPVHLLQIWLLPGQTDLEPSYEQRYFSLGERQNRFRAIATPNGDDGSVVIHQDATIYSALIAANETVTHAIAPGRSGWLQVATGAIRLNGLELTAGDAALISPEDGDRDRAIDLDILSHSSDTNLLLFDLAA
jgi:redox-sensitive bicupin YhaK (pirin superfamily)